jgi:hypothetical protein
MTTPQDQPLTALKSEPSDLLVARKRGRERLKMWSTTLRIFSHLELLEMVGIRPRGKTRRIRKKWAKRIIAGTALNDIWEYAHGRD